MNPLARALQTIFDTLDGILSGEDARGVLTTLQECISQAESLGNLAQENEMQAAELDALKERQKKELFVLKTNHESELQRFHLHSASELEKLQALLSTSNEEVNRLRVEEEKRKKEQATLKPIESDILRILGGQDFPVIAEFMADTLKLQRVLIKHHLDALFDGKYVIQSRDKGLPVWALDKKGRAYVAQHGLFAEKPKPKPTLKQATIKAGELAKKGIKRATSIKAVDGIGVFTAAQQRLLKFLDEHGEVTAKKVSEAFGMQLQSAEGQLNDLQSNDNKIVFAQWRGPDYVFSLGTEGKKWAAKNRK